MIGRIFVVVIIVNIWKPPIFHCFNVQKANTY